jgi:hypothetical protein
MACLVRDPGLVGRVVAALLVATTEEVVRRNAMGLLTDIFVADAEDARQYEVLEAKGELSSERFERAEFKGLTDLSFGNLWAVLEAKPFDLKDHALETVALHEEGETWLFRFPPQLVARLSVLTPSDVARVADAWASAEGFGCLPAHLAPVVEALMRLARSAERSSRGLFLWGSL